MTTWWSTIWVVNARQGQPQREEILDTNLTHDTWVIYKDDYLSPSLSAPFQLFTHTHTFLHDMYVQPDITACNTWHRWLLLGSRQLASCFPIRGDDDPHTHLIPAISDFHVPVTVYLSAPGCCVGCTSRITNNSFTLVSFKIFCADERKCLFLKSF